MTAVAGLALSVVAWLVLAALVERGVEALRLWWEGLEHRRALRDALAMFEAGGARADCGEERAA